MSPRWNPPVSTRRSSRRRPPAGRAATRATTRAIAMMEPVEQRTLMSASLDPSWNGHGLLSIAPPPGAVARTTVIGVQPDERVLVGGIYSVGTTNYTQIVRYTAQGALDSTWHHGSPVVVGYAATGLDVEASGSVLVVGSSMSLFNSDGSTNTGFGGGTGSVSLPLPLAGAAFQADGKILLSGNTASGDPEVLRYNSNGTIDTTYGINGAAPIDILGGASAVYKIGSVAVASNGEAIVGFAVDGNMTLATFGTVELTATGGFDQSYGDGGVAELVGYAQTSVSGGLDIAPNGVIYQVGTYNYGSANGTGYLMVYAANGKYADISPTGGLDTFAQDVTVASDNKPVIIGTAVQGTGASTQTVIAVDRFLPVVPSAPVFTPDVTFGGTGLEVVAYNGPSAQDNASVGDIGFGGYEMANGNVVVAGTSVNPGTNLVSTFNVTRLTGDASLAAGVGTITGLTFFDTNFNGTLDSGEGGLPNFGVALESSSGAFIEAVDADAGGRYTFNDLAPGTYELVQGLAAGFTHTTTGGTPTATVTGITVGAGQTIVSTNFGITGTDSISGEVFHDVNSNAVLDNGEVGLAGITVYLDLSGNATLTSSDPSVTTNSSGAFTFTHLIPLPYLVRIVLPMGDTITTPTTLPLAVSLLGNMASTGNLFGIV